MTNQLKNRSQQDLKTLSQIVGAASKLLKDNELLQEANEIDRDFYTGTIDLQRMSIPNWETSLDTLINVAVKYLPFLYKPIDITDSNLATISIFAYFRAADNIANGSNNDIYDELDIVYKNKTQFILTVIPQLYNFLERFIAYYRNRVAEGKLTKEHAVAVSKKLDILMSKLKFITNDHEHSHLHIDAVMEVLDFSNLANAIVDKPKPKQTGPLVIEGEKYPHNIRVNNKDIDSKIDEKALMNTLRINKTLARMIAAVLANLDPVRNMKDPKQIINTLFSKLAETSWYTKIESKDGTNFKINQIKTRNQIKVEVKKIDDQLSIEFSFDQEV